MSRDGRNFTSDNVTGVAPAIIEAILAANRGRVPSYGGDPITQRLTALAAAVFETEPSVFQLDSPLPGFILARPKLEGSQSRSDLIIDLAAREQLTVRQIISRIGGGRGH